MDDFRLYFETGWQHIISWEAADHILFITALAAIYLLKNWKQILVLVTAFTIGHSLTLALSVYDVFRMNSSWVEFLIPCTIIATAVFNLFQKKAFRPKQIQIEIKRSIVSIIMFGILSFPLYAGLKSAFLLIKFEFT